MEGTCTGQFGYVVCVFDINTITEALVNGRAGRLGDRRPVTHQRDFRSNGSYGFSEAVRLTTVRFEKESPTKKYAYPVHLWVSGKTKPHGILPL